MLSRVARGIPRTARVAQTVRHMGAPATTSDEPNIASMTGTTGFGAAVVLGGGYAIANEILILHAETVVAFSMASMIGLLYQKAGPSIAASFDERAEQIEESLLVAKTEKIAELEAAIAEEKTVPASLAAIDDIFELNKEVALMAAEVQYRTDLAENSAAVHAELDFLMRVENETKQAEKQLLIDQVVAGVLAEAQSQEGAILKQCVADLNALSASQ